MEKILIFDIWGDLAHFKKPYTTTSPITYSIPSRTTIAGMIGAILGLEKNKPNVELSTKNSYIALRILNPVKKMMVAQNFIDTKKADKMGGIRGRTQIRVEYLKDVKYRVYYKGKDYEKLKKYLKEHCSTYTLSLGLSECLANFSYVGEFDIKESSESCLLDSVINTKKISPEKIEFSSTSEIFSDRFAIEMNYDREVTEYADILFERNGGKISLKEEQHFEVMDENKKIIEKIIFL